MIPAPDNRARYLIMRELMAINSLRKTFVLIACDGCDH